MKKIKKIQCGRIDGKYYRTTQYDDGTLFGVVEKRRNAINNQMERVKSCIIS
jgi:hypothetical protein